MPSHERRAGVQTCSIPTTKSARPASCDFSVAMTFPMADGPPAPAAVSAATIAASISASDSTPGSARLVSYASDDVRVHTSASSDAFLVLTDTYYPGWRVWVDGAERNILRTNYSFRGIMLIAGHHTIELMYEAKSFELGLSIAGITSAALVAGTIFTLLKGRKHV